MTNYVIKHFDEELLGLSKVKFVNHFMKLKSNIKCPRDYNY